MYFMDTVINECHVLELRIRMNGYDHRSFLALLKQERERPEKVRNTYLFIT